MLRRSFLAGLCLAASAGVVPALAQDTVRIGLILPMTGASSTTGKQAEAAVRLFMQQNGTSVAAGEIAYGEPKDEGESGAIATVTSPR